MLDKALKQEEPTKFKDILSTVDKGYSIIELETPKCDLDSMNSKYLNPYEEEELKRFFIRLLSDMLLAYPELVKQVLEDNGYEIKKK